VGRRRLAVKVKYRPLALVDISALEGILPINITSDTAGFVAYDIVSRETVGAFVCQDWTKNSVQVHQAILNPMVIRHGFYEECADYIFSFAGRKKAFALVASDNKKALSVNRKIGFTEITRLIDAVTDGVDYVVMELKREECRYWKPVRLAA
jgi:hypothetical protein